MLNGNGVAEVQPKAEVVRRTIPKEWKAGWQLIRLLNSKRYDDDEVVTTASVKGSPAGATIQVEDLGCFEDGAEGPLTFGELRYAVEDGAVNSKGESCNDYVVVWSLTWPEAKGAIEYLSGKPDKAKPSAKTKGAGTKGSGNAGTSAEASLLKEVMAALAAMQSEMAELRNPAKPVPANGHRKVAAKPQTLKSETTLRVGDIITIVGDDGEPYQRQIVGSPKGFRLNKTIV